MRTILILIVLTCLAGPSTFVFAGEKDRLRVATFNVAMGLDEAGDLGRALANTNDNRLQQVAGILQRVRPDIVLLNEFDYDPEVDAAALFNANYLGVSQNGQEPLRYPFHFRAPVNTGVDSGEDLDRDGQAGGPGDGWGFGRFPGQYGMIVLSRYPIDAERSRTFQQVRWSALPKALRPVNPDGSEFYSDEIWQLLRLSSKSHWDVVIETGERPLHLLAHHPTPPVFDGPEDRNGKRNFDEIRFWLEYTRPDGWDAQEDDKGQAGGIGQKVAFVIAGDFNADPNDGDSLKGAVDQLLDASWINSTCVPASRGGNEAARLQEGVNVSQQGDPAADTSDFNDRYTGNLRLDYVLPSSGLTVAGCGVFWPTTDEPGHDLVEASDHRLVWLDIKL